jgi:class I fructose-bisphosphate aldolase
VYSELTTDNPIDLTQVAGRELLRRANRISSTPAVSPRATTTSLRAVRTAVINKRAGGQGLIVGRKAFQRPIDDGAGCIMHAVQDVYLDQSITVA